MTPVTIKELYDRLGKLVQCGKGDYPIFLADDEEGNGYHGCWYSIMTADNMKEDFRTEITKLNRDISVCESIDKAAYLG